MFSLAQLRVDVTNSLLNPILLKKKRITIFAKNLVAYAAYIMLLYVYSDGRSGVWIQALFWNNRLDNEMKYQFNQYYPKLSLALVMSNVDHGLASDNIGAPKIVASLVGK